MAIVIVNVNLEANNMRKFSLSAIILLLVTALSACGGGAAPSATPSGSASSQQTTRQTASPPASNGTEPEEEGRGDLFDETVPDGADDVIGQGVYYYETVDFSGDYGDGVSPRNGADLTNELLADMGLYTDDGGISADQCVYISLDELEVLDSAEGRECYIYSVGIGTPEGGFLGDDYQVIYRVSVDYSGEGAAEVYEDFDGRGDSFEGESEGESITLTLYADMSAGIPVDGLLFTKEIELTLEDNPASYPHYIVAALAEGLSEWTWLDFTLGEVTFDGDSVSVEWAADSTLIAGLDDRDQNPEFHMYDANGLNWFMMDSLAQTLKYNLDMTTVYYSSGGGPVTFTNPEDMAADGLPELPVDQPYEGSGFFRAHSGAYGDPGDTNDPAWWGEFTSYDTNFSIGISNYGGAGFTFDFSNLLNGDYFLNGFASINSDDNHAAEYGDITFALSEDFSVIEISAPDSSEWAHLSGFYDRIADSFDTSFNSDGGQSSLRIDFWLDGLVLDRGNEYILDDEVRVHTAALDVLDIPYGEDVVRSYIDDYLSYQDQEVSEWLSVAADDELTAKTTYPVWVAEYYVGQGEDTNICADAVVMTDVSTLILHTVRDADLDMNSDTDYGARINELFATMEIVSI
jgi:hypothetical protein